MAFLTNNLITVPVEDIISELNDLIIPELSTKLVGGLQSHSIANVGGSLTPAASVFQGRQSKFTGDISSDRDVIQPLTDTPAGPNVVWNIARPPDAAGYAAQPRYVTLKVTGGANEVGFAPGFSRLVGHDGTELRAWTPEYNPSDDTAKVSGLAVGTGTRNATSGFIEPAIPNQRTGGAAGYQVINARRVYTDLDKHAPGVYDPTTGNGPYIISKFEGISSYLQIEATGNLASDQEIYGTRSLVQEQSTGRTHAGKILGNTGEVFNSGTSRLEVVYCDWKLFNQSSSGNGGLIVGDLSQIDTSSGSTGLLDLTIGSLSQYTLAGGTDITSARGFNSALTITGTTTDVGIFYHFRADTPSIASGATCATLVGFDCFDQSGVTGVTTHYNFRSRGANSRNQWEGKSSFGSATAPVSVMSLLVAPVASANYGTISLGSGPFDGATAGFFTGSANGTQFAINAASGSTADLFNLQVAGVEKFKVTSAGLLSIGGNQVLGTRKTGWSGDPTGTFTRTTFDSDTATLAQVAQRLAALIVDLRAHGMIGT